jgi:hypothetical protein
VSYVIGVVAMLALYAGLAKTCSHFQDTSLSQQAPFIVVGGHKLECLNKETTLSACDD